MESKGGVTMGVGLPMDPNSLMMQELRRMVEEAAGAELVAGIRESDRRVREMWSHMTDEEIANWIMGE
jgi:hypothetical protein